MSHEPIPHPILVVHESAELRRFRAGMLAQKQSLLENISASRELLAGSSEALAKAEHLLAWWQGM